MIIPNSVTTIEHQAFECCYALKSMTIGSNVTTIGENAFRYCDRLETVTVKNRTYEEAVALMRYQLDPTFMNDYEEVNNDVIFRRTS